MELVLDSIIGKYGNFYKSQTDTSRNERVVKLGVNTNFLNYEELHGKLNRKNDGGLGLATGEWKSVEIARLKNGGNIQFIQTFPRLNPTSDLQLPEISFFIPYTNDQKYILIVKKMNVGGRSGRVEAYVFERDKIGAFRFKNKETLGTF